MLCLLVILVTTLEIKSQKWFLPRFKNKLDMQIWQLTKGLLGFLVIWTICLAALPLFLAIIGAKYANDFLAAKKVKKILAPNKKMWHVPATTDNNIHSYN